MDYSQIDFSKSGAEHFPAPLRIEVINVDKNFGTARLEIQKFHFAPNGYLHAGSDNSQ